MGLGGYSPPPEAVSRAARAAGPIAPGGYRVITQDSQVVHYDFATLEEARKQADDAVSEADDVAPAAYLFDSSFECVDIGIHYGIRLAGKSAWESYLVFKSRAGPKE